MAFFRKCDLFFKSPNLKKKNIPKKTILNLNIMLWAEILNFKLRIVFGIFFFGDLKNKSHFLKKKHLLYKQSHEEGAKLDFWTVGFDIFIFFSWKRLCCITFQDHKSQLKNLDAFFWKWPLNKPVLKKRSLHWNSRVHKGIRAFKEFLPSQKILCRNSIWKRSFRAVLCTLSYNIPSKYIGKYFLYAGFKFL